MSEFWKRKMKTYFKAMDVNEDGVISEEDFHLLGSQICDKENADPGRRQKVAESFEKAWDAFTKQARKDEKEPMTVQIFVESVKKQRNDPGYVAILAELCRALYIAMDTNQDGFIQEDEHRRLFEDAGSPNASSFPKIAFQAMDTNHDGKLSIDELVTAYVEFMLSEDEKSPFQFFFGPLI